MITPKEDYSMERFDPETVTVQDCLDNYYMKGLATVVSNGEIRGFVKEIGECAENRTKRRGVGTVQRFTAGVAGGILAVTG